MRRPHETVGKSPSDDRWHRVLGGRSVCAGSMMPMRLLLRMEHFGQGWVPLIERVADVEPSGTLLEPDATGAWVLAEGEFTGHRHAIYDRVTMFRDEALAREIPAGLYVGHIKVAGGSALIHHQEHAPVSLTEGTYRVRRQRELEPRDAVLVSD